METLMDGCNVWKAADHEEEEAGDEDEGEFSYFSSRCFVVCTWQRHHGRRMEATW